MKELLEFILKALVDDSAAVEISSELNDGVEVFKVKLAKEDIGKVIGKQGKNIKAIRTIIKAVSAREGKRTALEIVE